MVFWSSVFLGKFPLACHGTVQINCLPTLTSYRYHLLLVELVLSFSILYQRVYYALLRFKALMYCIGEHRSTTKHPVASNTTLAGTLPSEKDLARSVSSFVVHVRSSGEKKRVRVGVKVLPGISHSVGYFRKLKE